MFLHAVEFALLFPTKKKPATLKVTIKKIVTEIESQLPEAEAILDLWFSAQP